jgi:hypothetical protein
MLTFGVVRRATTLWWEYLWLEQYPRNDLTWEYFWLIIYVGALVQVVVYLLLLRRKMASSGEVMTLEQHRELAVITIALTIIMFPFSLSGTSQLVQLLGDQTVPDRFLAYYYWVNSYQILEFFVYLSFAILAWRSYEHERPLFPICIDRHRALVLTIILLVLLVSYLFRAFGWLRYYTIEDGDLWNEEFFNYYSPIWFYFWLPVFIAAFVLMLYTWNKMRGTGALFELEHVEELAVISLALTLLMFPFIIYAFDEVIDHIHHWDWGANSDPEDSGFRTAFFYSNLGYVIRFSAFLSMGLLAYRRFRHDRPIEVVPLD